MLMNLTVLINSQHVRMYSYTYGIYTYHMLYIVGLYSFAKYTSKQLKKRGKRKNVTTIVFQDLAISLIACVP